MALDELDRVRRALGPSDREDPAKVRSAIGHASIAIGCLSKEVTRMPLFRTGSAVMTRGIAMMPSADPIFHTAVSRCPERHCSGNLGDVDEGTWQQNDEALVAERDGGTSTPCSASTTPMASRYTSSQRLNVGDHDTVPGRVLKPWSGAIPTYKSSVDRNRLNLSGIWTCHDMCLLSLRDSGHAAVQLLPILWTDDHNCSGSDQRNETVLTRETGMQIRHPRFGIGVMIGVSDDTDLEPMTPISP